MGKNPPLSLDELQQRIRLVRGKRVILDADLAALYGVSTSRFNQAIKRNAERFPVDFRFQLTPREAATLASADVINDSDQTDDRPLIRDSSQIVTSSPHRGAAYLPWAFSEHGALMAANVLRSGRAIDMSIYVIRAFIDLREPQRALPGKVAQLERKVAAHDSEIAELFEGMSQSLAQPETDDDRKIGYHRGNR